jgi:hypothetical protein
MHDEIATGKISTIAFMEFQKLYARNADVASNVEGALHQMAGEGFRGANFEPQNIVVKEARALIVGAMPPKLYRRKWNEWKDSGWSRRFLWCHFQLLDPEIIMEAIDRWTPIDFGRVIYAAPATGTVPFTISQDESAYIRNILRRTKNGYESIPFVLLKKILAVLKWRHAEKGARTAARMSMEFMEDFSECLKGTAELQIDMPLHGSTDEDEDIHTRKSPRTA